MTQDPPAETQHKDALSTPPHRPWWQAPWVSSIILLIIVLLGGFLRSKSLYTWDGGTSQHPDERFYARVTADLRLPDSFGSYLDAARSPANPHNVIEEHQFFVYGTLPPLLTRTIAVMLTPALPDESPVQADTPASDIDAQTSNAERHIPRLPPLLLHALNPDGKDMTAYSQIITIGRSLAVLFDMISIVLVYLIARQLWDRRTGLLAALLIALTVLHIQQTHFFVDPAFSTCFALLALYWAVRGAQRGDVLSFALLGVSIGAAAATRITLATLGLVALVAAVLVAVQAHNTQPNIPETTPRPSFWKLFVRRSVPLLVLAGVLTLLSFRVLHPYMFIGSQPDSPNISGASDSANWMHGQGFFDVRLEPRTFRDLDLIKRMQNGSVDYPPSFQWVNRLPYIYPLANLVVWGMGIPAGVAALLGWLIAGFWYIRPRSAEYLNRKERKERKECKDRTSGQSTVHCSPEFGNGLQSKRLPLASLVVWLWIGFYVLWQGGRFAATMRYMLPITGPLLIFGAWMLVRLADSRLPTSLERIRRLLYNTKIRSVRLIPNPVEQCTISRPAARSLRPLRALRFKYSAGRGMIQLLPLIIVVVGTFGWAYAFTRIYTRPHTRVIASQWLLHYVYPGAHIADEWWDDRLPLRFMPNFPWHYDIKHITLSTYARDVPDKYLGNPSADVLGLLDQLETVDFITLTSSRIYGSVQQLPMRYPATIRFYDALFSGELGFTLVADITSYPSLLSFTIPDQGAEESFHVYDHPRVLIFRKTHFSREQAERLIIDGTNWDEVYTLPIEAANQAPTALRLTTSEWPRYHSGGTWSAMFQPRSIVNTFAPLIWLLVLEMIGLAMFALLFRLLPRLPDRGFSLARGIGLLIVAYSAWLGGSVRLLPFTPLSVWLCALPLLVLGGWVGWRERTAIVTFVWARRGTFLLAYAIYLLAFGAMLTVRWLNPDLWHPWRGGEKPMEFAYLNAILQSSAFPPYDPWFAGGIINYYYFGFVIVGTLIHLTTIVPSIAFNLAVPTIFALTALGAWGVVYNLIAPATTPRAYLNRKERKERKDRAAGEAHRDEPAEPHESDVDSGLSARIVQQEWRARLSGILAPIGMLILGNLAQATWFFNGYAAEQEHRPEWAFWDATRIVDGTINEFPFFTFLFADMHPHMIVMPFSLALLGLCVVLVRHVRIYLPAGKLRSSDLSLLKARASALLSYLLVLVLMGLLAGTLRATNTWDYPTYVGLTIVTLGLVYGNRYRRARNLASHDTPQTMPGTRTPDSRATWINMLPLFWHTLLSFVLATTFVIVLGNLFFIPFTSHFATESSGIELLRDTSQSGLVAQVWSAQRTTVREVLTLYGMWLFILVSAAVALIFRWLRMTIWVTAVLAFSVGILVVATAANETSAPVLLVPLALGAGVLLWYVRHLPPRIVLPLWWGAMALAICLGVELVYVRGDVGRMNTVFKFGLHAWTLYALTAAVAIPWIWSTYVRTLLSRNHWMLAAAQWAWRGALIVLCVAALFYPATATPSRIEDRYNKEVPPTLDGTAFMPYVDGHENEQSFPLIEDYEAIRWLHEHAQGTPVILEAHQPAYRWGARIATFTGLPTLLGWEWHQIQQRSVVLEQALLNWEQAPSSYAIDIRTAIERRKDTVADIFNTTDVLGALDKITSYGIEYIYVGGVEHALYDPAGLAKFNDLTDMGYLERAFESGNTTIYRVVTPGVPSMLTLDTRVELPSDVRTPPPLMLEQSVNTLPPVPGYAWNTWANGHSWNAVLVWLIALYVLAITGFPLTFVIFRRWQDGGIVWARLLSLMIVGYAVWLPTSLRLTHNSIWNLAGGFLVIVLLDIAALVWLGRTANSGSTQRDIRSLLAAGVQTMRSFVQHHRRQIILSEAIFLVGFACFTLIRAFNPDLWHPVWGGEKPMEMGFLNAITRSSVIPPYTPFFSDGFINYYYYGFFLVSLLIKATGIAPTIAFNLIVPTLFAMTLSGSYAIVRHITGRVRYGLVGAAFLALLGNLASVLRVGWAQGIEPVLNILFNTHDQTPFLDRLLNIGTRLGEWYVGPSRIIVEQSFTINEFPYWSYLFADLHPHIIALPMTLLVIALAYQVLRGNTSLPLYATIALSLGTLAVTNSWDFPTYTLLITAMLAGHAWRHGDYPLIVRLARVIGACILAGMLAAGGMALYTPFFDHYYPMVSGIGQVKDTTSIRDYLVIYGVYLAILVPLFLGAAWRMMAMRVDKSRRRSTQSRAAQQHTNAGMQTGSDADDNADVSATQKDAKDIQFIARTDRIVVIVGRLSLGLLLVVLARTALLDAFMGLRMWLVALLLIGSGLLLPRRTPASTWFVFVLALLAWSISLGIDTIFIRDHLAGAEAYRMNTVFKFGLHIWTLLSLGAAIGLPIFLRGLERAGKKLVRFVQHTRVTGMHALKAQRTGGLVVQTLGIMALGPLVLMAAMFPLFGTPSRIANRFDGSPGLTLDGLAFLTYAAFNYEGTIVNLAPDAAGIAWLNENLTGTPIVAQSGLFFYRMYGIRVAASTGFPTIVSSLHENEQRDPGIVGMRDGDLETLYRTTDPTVARDILTKYRVDYVYVGSIERAFYPAEGLAKFATTLAPMLEVVFEQPGVTIYNVLDVQASQTYESEDVPESQPAPTSLPTQPATGDMVIPENTAELANMVADDPTNSILTIELAQRYRQATQLDDALLVIDTALSVNPNDSALYMVRGDILVDIGRFDEAEQAHQSAAMLSGASADWTKLGGELLRWNKPDKAEIALIRAIMSEPVDPEAYYHLAQVYLLQGEQDTARKHLSIYVQQSPDGLFAAEARNLLEALDNGN